MSKFTKVVSTLLVVAAVVTFVAPAKAQTADELKAQVAQLQAALAALTAQLGGTATTPATSAYTFTKNLTVGSKGAEVSALQDFLASKGFLTATARGYFGLLTKAALAKYQASVGITPASGYFGAITRAQINQSSVVVVPTPSTTPTASTSPSATPTSTTLNGGEGIMTVEAYGSPAQGIKTYESDVQKGVFGIKVKAQNSDLRVERVKVQIGSAVTSYTKQIKALTLLDGSTVLAKMDLSSSNVVKEGSNYFVYFTGLNTVVPMNSSKVYTVAVDIYSTVESAYQGTVTLTLPANGVRAKDAVGLDIQGPDTAIPHTFSINNNQSENASLTVSKNANSPKATTLVSNNDGDVNAATVLAVDLKAKDGLVKIDQANLSFAGNAQATVAYLYDGSTLLQSATVSGNSATFTDLEDTLQVAKDTTKTLTVKVDYTGATTTAATSTVTFNTGATLLAYNEDGSTVTESGSSAVSDQMNVSSVAPVFTFGAANVSKSNVGNSATTSALVTLPVTIQAQGDAIYVASTSAAVVAIYSANTGALVATSTAAYLQPSNTNAESGYYKIEEDTSATFNFTYNFDYTGTSVQYYAKLVSVSWKGVSTGAPTQTTSGTIFDDFKTTTFLMP
jgi:hypothetical protein